MATLNRLETHWNKAKTFIGQEWPELSPTAIEGIQGNYDRFLKVLKEYYNNFPREEAIARQKLQKFLNRLDNID